MRAELFGHRMMTKEVPPRLPQNNENIVYFEKRKTLETAISKVLG